MWISSLAVSLPLKSWVFPWQYILCLLVLLMHWFIADITSWFPISFLCIIYIISFVIGFQSFHIHRVKFLTLIFLEVTPAWRLVPRIWHVCPSEFSFLFLVFGWIYCFDFILFPLVGYTGFYCIVLMDQGFFCNLGVSDFYIVTHCCCVVVCIRFCWVLLHFNCVVLLYQNIFHSYPFSSRFYMTTNQQIYKIIDVVMINAYFKLYYHNIQVLIGKLWN